MPENDDNETVANILKRKKGSIKQPPLDPGSPSWDDILGETWKSVKRKRDLPVGYYSVQADWVMKSDSLAARARKADFSQRAVEHISCGQFRLLPGRPRMWALQTVLASSSAATA